MKDRAAVLFANEAFYVAFATGDLTAMDTVWARNAMVSCIHPGWSAIEGREHVMGSWRAILSGGEAPSITMHHPRAFLYGDLASVICYEDVGGGTLVATNLFVRENETWKLVHHQAGPAGPASAAHHDDGDEDDEDENDPPFRLMQ